MSAMAGNSPTYLVHPTFSRRPPILWRVGRGTYQPYDAAVHGEPGVDEADALGVDEDFGEGQLPVWRLIERAGGELPSPFTVQEVLDWFDEHHPDVLPATVRAHMSAMAGNSPAYLVHPTFSRRPPILWRVGRGTYEPYDAAVHGEPGVDEADALGVDEGFGEGQLPVWRLIERAGGELPSPFTVQEVLDWFDEHHPDVLPATVRAHMSAIAGNSPAYLVHPTFSRRPPILWRVGRGTYEPYDPRRHGAVPTVGSHVDEEPEDAVDAVQEFVLEQYLEEFLASNWDRIAFGRRLELWSPDDRAPRQFDASPAGRVDFLCRDLDTDAIVVVELKRGTPSDAVVGQTLRYMGWIRREIARPDQRVEGIIVVGEPDEKLLLAASATPAIRIVRYRIDFSLEVVDEWSG